MSQSYIYKYIWVIGHGKVGLKAIKDSDFYQSNKVFIIIILTTMTSVSERNKSCNSEDWSEKSPPGGQ